MTYSIVARDPATGQLGVAVQTCMFAVGAAVPWAIAGVGAVASQAIAEPAYGPRALDAMAAGAAAPDALAQARELDPMHVLRQVGVVDAAGRADAFTGELCIDRAGHVVGDGWAVQANMMASDDVWPAMGAAYESSRAPFAERLLAVLRAGEQAGGDARGRMSAALLVVDGARHDAAWEGRLLDLRVDHDVDDPIAELTRLYNGALAYQAFNRGVDALMGGRAAVAVSETRAGLAVMPGDRNLRFLLAGALVANGDVERGTGELRELIAERPEYAVVVRSFAERGLMAMPPGVDLDELDERGGLGGRAGGDAPR